METAILSCYLYKITGCLYLTTGYSYNFSEFGGMSFYKKTFPYFIGNNLSHNSIGKHLIYWLLFILFFTIIWGTYDNDYYRNFMIQIFSLPARTTLVYVTLYVLIPSFFLKKKYISFIMSFFILLIGTSIVIQRPLIFYVVQPLYLPDFKSDHFFAVTEIMNTILDVNLAVIFPLGYVFFKSWQKTNQKTIELEKKQLKQSKEENFIYLKVEKSLLKVFLMDIVYVESQKNYIKLKTTEREIVVHKSISSIQKSLPEKQFLRVHRSYIVAIKFIDSFSPSKLILKGVSIPVGRKYKDEVKVILGYF